MKTKKGPKVKVTTSDNRMGTARQKTPVKIPKKKGPTRPPRVASAAPMQNNALASPREWHDPESDMHTLTRAEAVKSNKQRHNAALAHGRQKLKEMERAIKVTTRDV